jgi:hypothetical protein
MREEYSQYVKDEGHEMEKEGVVSFTTKKEADDYVEKATRRGFAVCSIRNLKTYKRVSKPASATQMLRLIMVLM